MVDGTGMCGSCRVTVGNKMKFACVDGPDFDGHLVNFDELMLRQKRFECEEKEEKNSMDIIVCVKHVPETAEADIKIDASGRAIEKSGLVFDINEWDDYALEEAVRIKEKQGGTVTAITIGTQDSESTLRKCLARGADKAIRLTDPGLMLSRLDVQNAVLKTQEIKNFVPNAVAT
jgi:hypothetical protein